jgi:hypothetical protein
VASNEEIWTTVWVVMARAAEARIYGTIAGIYTSEEAAQEHAATGDYTVLMWAAGDRFHKS